VGKMVSVKEFKNSLSESANSLFKERNKKNIIFIYIPSI